MILTELKEIISYGIVAAESIVPGIVSIIALCKSRVKEKKWTLTKKIAREAMGEVESYAKTHYMTSAGKLQMCLQNIEITVKASKLAWDDEIKENITKYVNEMCSWSKTVNYK